MYPARIRLYTRILRAMVRTYYKVYVQSNRELCLVYQMGKVASSSVASVIEAEGSYRQFQVHRLNLISIGQMNRNRFNRGLPPLPSDVEGRIVYTKFVRRGVPCKIVSLVREPVGRNISAFFENACVDRDVETSMFGQEALTHQFLHEYSHDIPLEWFDREMLTTTGIDVYGHDFPKKKGYRQIDRGGCQLLVMRHDLRDGKKVQILNEFLGTRIEEMCSRNVGSEKIYKDRYEAFKRHVRLPRAYLDRMLQSKYCRHFYSEEEIVGLYKKYMRMGDSNE